MGETVRVRNIMQICKNEIRRWTADKSIILVPCGIYDDCCMWLSDRDRSVAVVGKMIYERYNRIIIPTHPL